MSALKTTKHSIPSPRRVNLMLFCCCSGATVTDYGAGDCSTYTHVQWKMDLHAEYTRVKSGVFLGVVETIVASKLFYILSLGVVCTKAWENSSPYLGWWSVGGEFWWSWSCVSSSNSSSQTWHLHVPNTVQLNSTLYNWHFNYKENGND